MTPPASPLTQLLPTIDSPSVCAAPQVSSLYVGQGSEDAQGLAQPTMLPRLASDAWAPQAAGVCDPAEQRVDRVIAKMYYSQVRQPRRLSYVARASSWSLGRVIRPGCQAESDPVPNPFLALRVARAHA